MWGELGSRLTRTYAGAIPSWGNLGFKIDKDLCWSHPVVWGEPGVKIDKDFAGAIPSCGGNWGSRLTRTLPEPSRRVGGTGVQD